MLRKLFTTISTILIFAAAAVPASAQMSDDQVLSYAKQAIASGQSTTAIVQELASKGVTMDQIQRVQATVNGATGMNALSGTVSTVGGQERMRRVAGTMNTSTNGLENLAQEFKNVTVMDTTAMAMNQMGTAGTMGTMTTAQNPYMMQQTPYAGQYPEEEESKIF